MSRSFAAQCNFRTVDAKHERIAARRAMGNAEAHTRQKAELHQTLRIVGRKVQVFQNRFFAPSKVHQRGLFFRFLSQCIQYGRGWRRCQGHGGERCGEGVERQKRELIWGTVFNRRGTR